LGSCEQVCWAWAAGLPLSGLPLLDGGSDSLEGGGADDVRGAGPASAEPDTVFAHAAAPVASVTANPATASARPSRPVAEPTVRTPSP
jgi:hypothetical protein